ncbi:MAG: cell division protein FtsQ/DivIB [Acidimicrobiales bacterium]
MTTAAPPRRDVTRPGPTIDPRIRQRRIAVTRDQGRRRLRVLISFVAAMALVVGTVVTLHLPWFRVSHLEVTGAARTGAAQVRSAAAPALHQAMVGVDTAAVAARVDRLPWVLRAQVDKSWPSTLVVSVVERVPVAEVADGSHWALLDRTGRVLAVEPARATALVALSWTGPVGPPGSPLPGRAAGALAVAAAVGPVESSGPAVPVPAVSVGPFPGGGVAVDLAGGAVVQLGAPSDLGPKMTALEALEAQVDLSGVKTIDLTVPGQPVLTRG